MQLTVRYFAAARAAAGVESTTVDIGPNASLADLETVLATGNPELRRVLDRSSYLRDEVAVCDRTVLLGNCTTLDVLPPFAGG